MAAMTVTGQAVANGVLRFAFPFLIDKNAMKPYLHFDGIAKNTDNKSAKTV